MNKHILKTFLLITSLFFSINIINADVILDTESNNQVIPGTQAGFKGGVGNKTLGKHIACIAISKINTKYVLGGRTISGFDCTGFTHYALTQVGIMWPYINNPSATIGSGSSYSARTMVHHNLMLDCSYLEPGDLVYLDYYKRWTLNNSPHVGIYLGGGNFIHATSSGGKVKVNNFKSLYNQPGQVLGCARPYTFAQETLYEQKYRNFSKTSQPIEGLNFAFSPSQAVNQINQLYWNEWGCEDTIENGGPVTFGGITPGGPTSSTEPDNIIKIDTGDVPVDNLEYLTPLAIDNNFSCEGLLGHVDNKKEPAYWIQFALNIIRIVAISALLLLSTIDLAKALSSQDEEKTKNAIKTTLKRFLYTIILFFLPILINIALGVVDIYGNEYNSDCRETVK